MEEEMKIIDMYGKEKTVTDLDEAINQAEVFKSYGQPSNLAEEFLEERKRYWTDIHQKLTYLQSLQNKANHGNE